MGLPSQQFGDRFFDKRIEDFSPRSMATHHVFRLRLHQVRVLVLAAWYRDQREEGKGTPQHPSRQREE
jgi:hypothetical protein